jgi:hypothetical protein
MANFPLLFILSPWSGKREAEDTTLYILRFDSQFFLPVLPQKYCLSNHELRDLPYMSGLSIITQNRLIITLKISLLSPSPPVGEGEGETYNIQHPPPPRSSPVKREDSPE